MQLCRRTENNPISLKAIECLRHEEIALSETILVINSGSSSLKFSLYSGEANGLTMLFAGTADGIGKGQGELTITDSGGAQAFHETAQYKTQNDAFDHASAEIERLGHPQIAAIGHRVVHGGPRLREHTAISPEVLEMLTAAIQFAPLHIPTELKMIRATQQRYLGVPQFACFDTAFHRSMPAVASTYALPLRYREAGVQHYGFHGISYESIVGALAPNIPARLVVAHLGSGASLCALQNGRSVDTSMGMTPTGGIPMGTRSGDLDPGVVLFLARNWKLSADDLESLLNHESGLAGLANGISDMRALTSAAATGSRDAVLAIEIFARSIGKTVAAYAAVLAGLDMLVFTGGIGEHSPEIRARTCAPLSFLGIVLDHEANARSGGDTQGLISLPTSLCPVRVLAADEDGQIARHVLAMMNRRGVMAR
jgi:acetate kinase